MSINKKGGTRDTVGWGTVLVMEVVERKIPMDNSEGLDPGQLFSLGPGHLPSADQRL